MLTQSLPQSAETYRRVQQREIAAAVVASRRLWRGMGDDFDSSFAAIQGPLLATVLGAQERVAEGALAYIPAVLEETGQARAVEPLAVATAAPLVGVAGDGRPVDGLLYGSVINAKQRVAAGATASQALTSSRKWLTMAVGTLLSDTGRQGESLGMATRTVGGYVRMLNPPSCSRCVILAGKRYSASTAFARHPGCDCRHVPASESIAGDLTVNPTEYVNSLTADEQDKLLGEAGAQAVRDGADLNQVVNARRGMRKAQIGGRDVLVTSEGTTRRGSAYRSLSPSRATDVRDGGRYARANRPRLMPETIAEVATDREDRLRLLRANGYLL